MADEADQDKADEIMDDSNEAEGAEGGSATIEEGSPGYQEMDDPNDADGDSPSQEFDVGEPMANDVTAIYDIPVQISAVLGRSSMQVSQLLKLGRGAVVELDRKVGEAIDIYVNNRLVARGEVVVVEDKLGVTMTEIVKSDQT